MFQFVSGQGLPYRSWKVSLTLSQMHLRITNHRGHYSELELNGFQHVDRNRKLSERLFQLLQYSSFGLQGCSESKTRLDFSSILSKARSKRLTNSRGLNPVELTKLASFLARPMHSQAAYEVKELRWWLFRKKLAQSERLPPTSAALNKAILPAHYQAMVWNNDRVASPHLLSPQSYGWERKGDE